MPRPIGRQQVAIHKNESEDESGQFTSQLHEKLSEAEFARRAKPETQQDVMLYRAWHRTMAAYIPYPLQQMRTHLLIFYNG